MVRLLWLSGLVAALAQAQQLNYATVQFDTAPRVIENNNSTLSVVPDTLMDTSPLLDTTSRIQKRKAIDVAVKVATVVGGSTGIVLGGKAGIDIYEYIAQKIKTKSDQKSCTLTYGTDSNDGTFEGYAFQATTSGSNCDTTAIYKTILNAVKECADDLHNAKAVRGCCTFTHGGTWTGHLRLTADPNKFPATTVSC
jgi:hypothetical protein